MKIIKCQKKEENQNKEKKRRHFSLNSYSKTEVYESIYFTHFESGRIR
jgi:hypothetical protein